MAIIWGLDMKELQWGKFKGSNMFNQVYHLRRSKMIVYQIAMLCSIISDSIGTSALENYVSQRNSIESQYPGTRVHNGDWIAIASVNLLVGTAGATIFGFAFILDLFWPERVESRSVKLAWKISSLAASLMTLATVIGLTIIVVARRSFITGVSPERAQELFQNYGSPNPIYKDEGKCVATVVFLWPAMVGAFASTYIMWRSIQHNDKFGPRAAAYRHTKSEEAGSMDLSSTQAVSAQDAGVDSNAVTNGNETAPEARIVEPVNDEPKSYPGT